MIDHILLGTIFSSPIEALFASFCGFGVGFLAGLLGVGGSFLLVPVLSFLPSVSIAQAVGSTACQMLGPATTALLARGIKFQNLKIPLILLGGIFIGVFSGGAVLEMTTKLPPIEINGREVSTAKLLIFSAYFILLISLGSITLWEAKTNRALGTKWLQRIAIPPFLIFEKETGRGRGKIKLSIPILCWFGLLTGFLSGLLGISGGLIILPGLISLFGIPVRQAALISLAIIWLIAIQSTIVHAYYGNVDLGLVVCLMVGGTVGARLGTDWGKNSKARNLKEVLAWLLLGSTVLVIIQLIRTLAF